MRGTWFVVAVAVGCAYPQEHFVADYADTFCTWDASCGGIYYSSRDSCFDLISREGEAEVETCGYDSVAARTCLSELHDLPCSEPWPQSCLDTFECPSN